MTYFLQLQELLIRLEQSGRHEKCLLRFWPFEKNPLLLLSFLNARADSIFFILFLLLMWRLPAKWLFLTSATLRGIWAVFSSAHKNGCLAMLHWCLLLCHRFQTADVTNKLSQFILKSDCQSVAIFSWMAGGHSFGSQLRKSLKCWTIQEYCFFHFCDLVFF